MVGISTSLVGIYNSFIIYFSTDSGITFVSQVVTEMLSSVILNTK